MRVRSAVVSVSNGRCCALPFRQCSSCCCSCVRFLMSAIPNHSATIQPFHKALIRLPTPFAPSRSLRGGVATGRRYSFGCKPLSALPHHPFFLSCTFRLGESLQAACVCFSTAAVQQRKRQQNNTFLFMASTLFRHALRQQAFVFRGQGSGRRKNAKIRWLVEDFLKILNARVVQARRRALAFRFFPP